MCVIGSHGDTLKVQVQLLVGGAAKEETTLWLSPEL